MLLSERLKKIEPGTLVLTPNQRMTVWAQKACYLPQVSICPLSQWIERLWQQLAEHSITPVPKLLQGVAAEIVWERVIAKTVIDKPLLRVLPTVRLAIKAWHLVQTWDISLQAPQFQDTDASQCFLEWAKQVQLFCEAEGWIDIPSMLNVLIEQLPLGQLLLPKRCVWLGFSELTPQQKRFMNALSCAKVEVSQTDLLSVPASNIHSVSCPDPNTELCAALAWANDMLSQDKTPFSTAIVMPQLAKEREQVLRAVGRQLPPNTVNVAAPRALSDYPFIQSALQALQLAKPVLEWAVVSRFLRSLSYVDALQEQHTRAQLELALREYGMQTVSWKHWLYQSKRLKVLQTRLQQLFHLKNTALRTKKTAKAWVAVLQEWLQAVGWPILQTLNAEEEALFRQWENVLQQYEALDPLLGRHSISTAIFRIQGLAKSIPYAVASRSEPIQILGLWEAIGLPFKRVWIMGLDNSTWPAEASPNPFLPYVLQKKYQLPHSSAEREYAVAQKVIQELTRSAPTVLFSHPLYREGHPVLPSRLLANLDCAAPDFVTTLLSKADDSSEKIVAAGLLMHQSSDPTEAAPPFTQTDTAVAGGTRILKLQTLCPFKAFAEIRLKTAAWPEPYLGLSAAQRGVMVHELLAQFWGKCQTQENLLSLPDSTLNAQLQSLVSDTLERWQATHPHRLTDAIAALESKRLMSLLWNWIAHEKQRPPFVVLAVETHQLIVVQGLTLKICIDRIDGLVEDSLATQTPVKKLILDYKTGRSVSTQTWLGEVLLEPQLPLYATTQALLPDAISFAIVHPETVAFRGLGALPACQGVKAITHWAEQMKQWKTALEDTVTRFLQGEAAVRPYHSENPCKNCHVTALCRVFEHAC
jgi:probable DNA repair protein